MEEVAVNGNGALNELERDLVISGREYLQAELPDLTTGDTPKDIQHHVEDLKDGGRKEALAVLAGRFAVYHRGLEEGEGTATIEDPIEEARILDASLTELRPHIQFWRSVTGIFGQR